MVGWLEWGIPRVVHPPPKCIPPKQCISPKVCIPPRGASPPGVHPPDPCPGAVRQMEHQAANTAEIAATGKQDGKGGSVSSSAFISSFFLFDFGIAFLLFTQNKAQAQPKTTGPG